MEAIWNSEIIAESDKTINIVRNFYFLLELVNNEFLVSNNTHTVCLWK